MLTNIVFIRTCFLHLVLKFVFNYYEKHGYAISREKRELTTKKIEFLITLIEVVYSIMTSNLFMVVFYILKLGITIVSWR